MISSIKMILGLLGIIGLNPLYQNKYTKIIAIVTVVSTFYVNVKNIVPLVLHYNGLQSISELYLFPALFVCLIKVLVLYIYNNDLKILLNQTKQFWADDKFGAEVQKRIQSKRNIVQKGIFTFSSLVAATQIIYMFLPLVIRNNVTIFTGIQECDVLSSPCFEIIHTYQVIVMTLHLAPAFCGFDILFCYFVGDLYCSLELLKEGLRNINIIDGDISNGDKLIVEFVDQHNFILKFISNLRHLYDEVLFALAFTSLFCYVYTLYTLTADGFPPTATVILRSGLIGFIFTIQMLYYSIGGTVIMEQSLSVATEVYQIDWWKKVPPEFRRKLLFMIMRSQKKENLTVGKLSDLNLEFFGGLLRSALSVFTLLLNIQDKSNTPNTQQ